SLCQAPSTLPLYSLSLHDALPILVPIITRAHLRGLRVVGWYLPAYTDPGADLRKLVAAARLGVDGLAVDIEARNVSDVGERNRRDRKSTRLNSSHQIISYAVFGLK